MGAISASCGEGGRAGCGRSCSSAIALSVTWRARLSDHLGGFNVELIEPHAARVLDDQAGARRHRLARRRSPSICLSAIRIRSSITARSKCSARLTTPGSGRALLVRWEMLLLQDLGFGLDLSECAATGDRCRPDLCLAEIGQGGFARRRPALLRPAAAAPALPPGGRRRTHASRCRSPALCSPAISSSATCSRPQGLALPAARERLIDLLARLEPHPEEALSRRLEG